MASQEKLLKEIKSLSESIRVKNRALKSGISEREKFLETTFKPITAPLKQIVQGVKTTAIPFEGDVILPISKYETEEFQDVEEKRREIQTTEEEEETEESEESEERGEAEVLKGRTSTSEEESVNPSNLSKLGIDIVSKGTLGRKYLLKMLHSAQPSRRYHTYGARLEDNGIMIGDSKLDIDDKDNIIINNNKSYKGTTGLFELIFKNKPGKFTRRDLNMFKNILEETNAHKQKYSKDLPVYRNRSLKYLNIISELFPSQVKRTQIKRRALSSAELNILHRKRRKTEPTSTGKGLFKNLYKTNVIYYNDINKLIDRMRLLHEAMEAGHTGLENEWVALVDELRHRGVIA